MTVPKEGLVPYGAQASARLREPAQVVKEIKETTVVPISIIPSRARPSSST
jgi:hypothetical protein